MKDPILILHGWGSTMSGEKYSQSKKIFEKAGYNVFTPDLPGFGTNIPKKEELFFEDYVEFVKQFILKHKLKKVILLGHSFGGRIATAFAATYPQYVSKLILIAPSGIPHPLPSLKKKFVYAATKIIKPFFLLPLISNFYTYFRSLVYYAIGEMDYYKAGSLSKTFKNVYKISIIDDLPKIKAQTLIIWGANDSFVPVEDGVLMKKNIHNSQLVVEKNEGHKFPYENPNAFAKHVLTFLQSI